MLSWQLFSLITLYLYVLINQFLVALLWHVLGGNRGMDSLLSPTLPAFPDCFGGTPSCPQFQVPVKYIGYSGVGDVLY